ncbi:MAG TPA: hypothetical protein VFQ90_16200 [Stellaceae bacterium]|jgi:hypothetical protein|nr:hypothetical protein [Stellaceae bacterium]
MRLASISIFLGATLLMAVPAEAGPPFRTDDPEPVELGHWEIFEFSTATHAAGDTNGILSGIDANYGAAPELQLHTTLPIAFDKPADHGMAAGFGDVEFGAKYRFLPEDEDGWRPQAAIYPAVDFPTGDAAHALGTGHTHTFLPVWLEKHLGHWVSFAGVGYWINPGAGNRNYWYLGWALQHQITDSLALGGELFHQTPNAVGVKDQTGFNLGATYDLSEHYHLLVSAGQGVQNRSSTNAWSYYVSLQLTF